MGRALLRSSDQAARRGVRKLRAAMQSAGLGKLGNAIGAGSDQAKGRGPHRKSTSLSASGWAHVRGRSERTHGTIEAYLEGAVIAPRNARYLWIPSKELQRTAGAGSDRRRLTPGNWAALGLETRIGPLEFRRIKGKPQLIVRDITTDRFGRGGAQRGPRRLPKRGRLGGTRQFTRVFVAFRGITHTSRTRRLDPAPIFEAEVASLPAEIAAELEKEF